MMNNGQVLSFQKVILKRNPSPLHVLQAMKMTMVVTNYIVQK
jgi:hypothetical protein